MKKILEFKDVSLKFAKTDVSALKNISISIDEGELITILGRSGSGKTTLIRLVNKLAVATEGSIFINGESISSLESCSLRRRIGYVIQQVGLFPHMTIAENISIIYRIEKMIPSEIDLRVNELLTLVQLPTSEEFKKRHPWQLSGGQQQRVGIARALSNDPHILLMDEPFGALDAAIRKELQSFLLMLQKKSRKTILFVTHDLHEAIKLGDRVLVLHEGVIQQFDTPRNIIFNPATDYVKSLFGLDSISKKISFFNLSDFGDIIKPSKELASCSVNIDVSMDEVLNLILEGNDVISAISNGVHIGNITRNDLALLGAGQ